jgi:hypothetical protein
LKYHILSKMTKDILVVLISTIVSEFSFSAGGRIIEPYKASLYIETIQILLYGSNWVRALHGFKRKSAGEVSFISNLCI